MKSILSTPETPKHRLPILSTHGTISSAFFPSIYIAKGISFFFFWLLYLFIYYLFFGCVGSSVRARAFSSCGKRGPLFIAVRGPLFIAVRGPLTMAAPPVAGHRLQKRRLSSCGSRAQPLRGMWVLPRPGLEPAFPALAGRFSTTAPPGKPQSYLLPFATMMPGSPISTFLFFF